MAALILSLATAAMAGGSLSVGSAAPAVKVAKWVKGTPVKSFEKGKVYVVEFWATWCGPCKQSIPHLTELAHKYKGKATFTGVSVYEKNASVGSYANYGEKVAAFVKEWGDKMDYNVCWDGDEAEMSHNWMEAAGQGGIPTAFVVDQNSKVVWIGHPMVGLDEVVGQVINGTFDAKAEADKAAKIKDEQAKRAAKLAPFMTPLRAKQYPEAVAAMDKAFAEDKTLELGYGMTKLMALQQYDMEKANAYALQLADGVYKDAANALNTIAWAMVDDKKPMKGADPKVAMAIAEKGVAATKDGDPMAAYMLDTLAFCQFKCGQIDKAIETQEKALKSAKSTKDFDAATLAEISGRLDMFKQKKGNGR